MFSDFTANEIGQKHRVCRHHGIPSGNMGYPRNGHASRAQRQRLDVVDLDVRNLTGAKHVGNEAS